MRVNLDLMTNIEGLNVLLVEDIVDSGRTLAHVLQMLRTREPKSLKVCVLLDKKYRREVPVDVDYVGFDVPDKYVFGYGIDIDEHYRHLRFIASADMKKYKKEDDLSNRYRNGNMAGEDENSYAGRWIARLRGRVVAQGGTPEQARRAAQSRYKETPEIVFMPTPYPLIFPAAFGLRPRSSCRMA